MALVPQVRVRSLDANLGDGSSKHGGKPDLIPLRTMRPQLIAVAFRPYTLQEVSAGVADAEVPARDLRDYLLCLARAPFAFLDFGHICGDPLSVLAFT